MSKKVVDLTELTTPASDDLFHIIDVSDITDNPLGTSKKITRNNVIGSDLVDIETNYTKASSSSATSLDLYEDTDNGTNKVTLIAPASIASNKTITLPDVTGTVALLQVIYPVGVIYTSVTSTNPATLFGFGTWVAFGAGRVLVGIDAGQTEFDVAEETGGAKTHTLTASETPAHTHTFSGTTSGQSQSHNHAESNNTTGSQDGNAGYGLTITGGYVNRIMINASGLTTGLASQDHSHTYSGTTSSVGSGAAHNNLQPYIVVYMFKRTA